MTPSPRKAILYSILAVFLSVGGVAFWIDRLASAKWLRMERRVSELRDREVAVQRRRLPSRGNTEPGEAWDDYLAALSLVHQGKLYTEIWFHFDDSPRGRKPKHYSPAMLSILKGHQETLRRLRQGAHKAATRRPQAAVWSYDPNTGDVPAQFLLSLARWEAKRLEEEGVGDESAEYLVDALEFASATADGAARLEYLSSLAAIDAVLKQLTELMQTRRLTTGKIEQVESYLKVLERSLPPYREAVVHEELLIGEALLKGVEGSLYPGSVRGATSYQGFLPGQRSWRYGFSKRLALASGFEWLDAWVGRLVATDAMAWSELKSHEPDFALAQLGHGTSVVSSFKDTIDPAGLRRERLTRTYFRLLLKILPVLRGGSAPELVDPFGGVLQEQSTKEAFRAWSVGSDGVDNGGKGEWEDEPAADVVLFLPNKP